MSELTQERLQLFRKMKGLPWAQEMIAEIDRLRSLIPSAEVLLDAAHMLSDGTLPVYDKDPKDIAKHLAGYAHKISDALAIKEGAK